MPDEEKKINFCFRNSWWCLKMFMKAFKTYKTFWGTTKEGENKNLS